ncbi:lipoprotein-anchoring transpeptidase ErfK/SrfK [Arthrobacter pigmenti]|uniref:Lipoprotein-anchoring transpeptidase ErfK/SrfK n=1 Tax=Arthrobacter pigmenti TaxID=271432 RepID=A0A846RRR6_9MICC|nr:Ig-like domain-containing protein [Arthrobacter pigmenti]NJC21756.1 lipoprotein-anchoring transpeptidase ErfK/SrfK [Arthrobacter pigmenti]
MSNHPEVLQPRRRGWKIGALVIAGLLVVAAVVAGIVTAPTWANLGSGSADSRSDASAADASSTPPSGAPQAEEYTFGVTPTDGATGVNPVTPPEIRAENATVVDVVLEPMDGGEAISGTVSQDGTSWKADERLSFATEYSFEFVLIDSVGGQDRIQQTFTTVLPANEANAWMYPADGSTVGTGQTIEITFSEPVTNKADVENAITITSTSGQEGAFYWLNDNKVRYRPQEFWEPHSTITVDMQLFGVDFGNGMIGNFDNTFSFQTHNTRLAVVDNATKQMQVFIDGKLERTFPVTLGTEEWPSFFGYYTVMEQYEQTKFTAESIGLQPGDPAYYEPTLVNYASRISNGGAFVHEALPAAQSVLGVTNVSHGCVGMSPEGAKYFYEVFGPGDMVQILNTSKGPVQVWDGFGDWNVPWPEWTAQQPA